MRIGFVVNDLATEAAGYTTVRLAMEATNLGHEAWFIGAGEFAVDADARIMARAVGVEAGRRFRAPRVYLATLRGDKARHERIEVRGLDVLMLRNDPADDAVERPWAQPAGFVFGRLAELDGVLVLNDPRGLAMALNKTYFEAFPQEIRPRTLITRDPAEVKAFAKDEPGHVILKPLQGSGGHNVFLVRRGDTANLNQIIETILGEGYIVVQEYLPGIEHGDVRLFLMNGRPLVARGVHAAFRRARAGGDVRSNLAAGGVPVRAKVDAAALRLAEVVRPKLVADGMFLVGLDLVGDKLMEVNVFSPGGLGTAEELTGVKFARVVVQAIERKVAWVRDYGRRFDNVEMATM